MGNSAGRAGGFENSPGAPHGMAQRQEGPSCLSSFTPGGLCLCQDKSVLPGCHAAVAVTADAALMVRSDAASFPRCGSHPPTASYDDAPFPMKVPIFKLQREGYTDVCSPGPLHSSAPSLCLTASSPTLPGSGLNIGRSISRHDGTEAPQLNILKQK